MFAGYHCRQCFYTAKHAMMHTVFAGRYVHRLMLKLFITIVVQQRLSYKLSNQHSNFTVSVHSFNNIAVFSNYLVQSPRYE
jgi:hypothetical protein